MHAHKARKSVTSWAEALEDGRAKLEEAKKRVRELKAAVRTCEQRVKAREPFPGQAQ